MPEAAAFFQTGEDYLRAAELFESGNMLAEAAGAYEAGEETALHKGGGAGVARVGKNSGEIVRKQSFN
jgi:hypothetical protein